MLLAANAEKRASSGFGTLVATLDGEIVISISEKNKTIPSLSLSLLHRAVRIKMKELTHTTES
jgi:hypothetical protein